MSEQATGLALREANPYLRDLVERQRRILDVVERNSVIEGLPPLTPELVSEIKAHLAANAGHLQAPDE